MMPLVPAGAGKATGVKTREPEDLPCLTCRPGRGVSTGRIDVTGKLEVFRIMSSAPVYELHTPGRGDAFFSPFYGDALCCVKGLRAGDMLTSLRKRDSRTVPFTQEKIARAVFLAAQSQGGRDYAMAEDIASRVSAELENRYPEGSDGMPDVEEVQDLVEKTLIELGHARTAKAYILYATNAPACASGKTA